MPTKPFWFAFNADCWLSSKSVRMMSLAERGAYIGLLATAWGEELPGTLPAPEDFIRRLSEMSADEWKVSGPVILAMFPLADCGTYRYNPRLLKEAGKREELSEKKAEAGRRSAAKRAAISTEGQHNANTIPTGVEINPTGVGQKGNQLQSQLQLQAKAEERAAAARPPMLDEGEPTVTFARSFFNTDKWLAVVADVQKTARYAAADFAHYRDVIRLADDTAPQELPNRHWRKKLMNWLENDAASKNGIVKPVASSQPKGKAENEITFELNPTAVARRRREAEEMEARIITANLDRINRNEGTNFTLSQYTGLTQ